MKFEIIGVDFGPVIPEPPWCTSLWHKLLYKKNTRKRTYVSPNLCVTEYFCEKCHKKRDRYVTFSVEPLAPNATRFKGQTC